MPFRIRAVAFACVTCCVAVVGAHQVSVRDRDDGAVVTSEERIRSLLEKRLDVLKRLVEVHEARMHQGLEALPIVIQAQDELFAVELELAKTKDDRLTLHRERWENRRQLYELQRRRADEGLGDVLEPLAAKAAMLAAEVDLVREEQAVP